MSVIYKTLAVRQGTNPYAFLVILLANFIYLT